MKLNNKGMAISGILYSLLVLFIVLIFGVLALLANSKFSFDKFRNDLTARLNGDIADIPSGEIVSTTLVSAIRRDNNLIDNPLTRPGIDNSLDTEASLVRGTDNDGETHYFRGNVVNNYVEFGIHPRDIWYYSKVINAANNDYTQFYYDDETECKTDAAADSISNCTKISAGSPMIWQIGRAHV